MYDSKEKNLRTLSSTLLIINIIASLGLLIYGFTLVGGYYTQLLGIILLISSLFYAFFAYIIYFALNILADTHYYARKTFEASNNPSKKDEIISNNPTAAVTNVAESTNKTPSYVTGSWQCKKCNKLNKNYVTTCACGQDKNKNN